MVINKQPNHGLSLFIPNILKLKKVCTIFFYIVQTLYYIYSFKLSYFGLKGFECHKKLITAERVRLILPTTSLSLDIYIHLDQISEENVGETPESRPGLPSSEVAELTTNSFCGSIVV